MLHIMADIAQILTAIERGDPRGEQPLPLVYGDRQLPQPVGARKARSDLQATSAVNEAICDWWVSSNCEQATLLRAAAEAMQRIRLNARQGSRNTAANYNASS